MIFDQRSNFLYIIITIFSTDGQLAILTSFLTIYSKVFIMYTKIVLCYTLRIALQLGDRGLQIWLMFQNVIKY